jgi:hypothetical protein
MSKESTKRKEFPDCLTLYAQYALEAAKNCGLMRLSRPGKRGGQGQSEGIGGHSRDGARKAGILDRP